MNNEAEVVETELRQRVRAMLQKHYHGQPTVFIDGLWDGISAELAAIESDLLTRLSQQTPHRCPNCWERNLC